MDARKRLLAAVRRARMRLGRQFGPAIQWTGALFRNQYFWGGIAALLIVGLAAYFLIDSVIMPSYTRHGVAVRVPNVEGQPFEQAADQIEERNLQVLRDVGRYNPRVDRNTVVDQNPPPNSDVKPGRRVYLTVNAGDVPMVRLPDLNGISVREATNRISSLGLQVDTVMADTIPAPYPNTVTRQRPEPGDSLERGKGVALWYSTGLAQDTVEVPDVLGQTVEQARDVLLNNRLRAIVVGARGTTEGGDETAAQDASEAKRFVRRQGRAPDQKVRAGTEIRLFTTTDSTAVPPPHSQRDTVSVEDGS